VYSGTYIQWPAPLYIVGKLEQERRHGFERGAKIRGAVGAEYRDAEGVEGGVCEGGFAPSPGANEFWCFRTQICALK